MREMDEIPKEWLDIIPKKDWIIELVVKMKKIDCTQRAVAY